MELERAWWRAVITKGLLSKREAVASSVSNKSFAAESAGRREKVELGSASSLQREDGDWRAQNTLLQYMWLVLALMVKSTRRLRQNRGGLLQPGAGQMKERQCECSVGGLTVWGK